MVKNNDINIDKDIIIILIKYILVNFKEIVNFIK